MTQKRKDEYTKLLAGSLPVLRKACGLSQTGLSELTGISRSALSVIENRKDMTWSQFLSVLAVLDRRPEAVRHFEAVGIDTDEVAGFLSGYAGREGARE